MTTKQLADKLGLQYEERRLGYHLTNNPNRLMKDGQTENRNHGGSI